jgi:hypothetical protein
MEIIKTPQSDIKVFLTNALNIGIFENLNKYCDSKFIDKNPLYFFNLIYLEADFYLNNDNNYLSIKNHFDELDIRVFEVTSLSNLLLIIEEVYNITPPNKIQLKSFEFLKNFINPYVNSDENLLKSILSDYTLYNFRNRINVYKNDKEKINYLIEIKARFLQEVIDYKGWESNNSFDKKCDIEIQKLQSKMPLETNNQNESEIIDLSNTKAIDKILYLHKLGVIDFLRKQQPFNTSVNSLATIFSAITGEKSGTLQPMLNPMLCKKVDDSNNPLNSKKAVDRVENQLIKIGFNLNKTI